MIASNTQFNNKHLFTGMNSDEDDHLFDSGDRDCVDQLMDAVHHLDKQCDDSHEQMRLYKERERLIRNGKINIDNIDECII